MNPILSLSLIPNKIDRIVKFCGIDSQPDLSLTERPKNRFVSKVETKFTVTTVFLHKLKMVSNGDKNNFC